MPQTTKKKTAMRPSKKQRAPKRQIRKNRGPKRSPQILSARNQEDLVIRKLVQAPSKMPQRSLEIQDLIYNSANELKALAFKSGFNIGAEAYRNSNGSINSLEHLLEHAGFGKVLYYPFESHSAFTSYGAKSGGINTGMNLHIFEAGVISGYLSAHTKRQISAEEIACVFNGSPYCKFVAREGSARSLETEPQLGLPRIINTLRLALSLSGKHTGEDSYYLVSIRPLLSEPVFSEALKFLYVSGKLVGRPGVSNFEKLITESSNFLRLNNPKVSKDKKGNISINIAYGHETSSRHFVDLTTAFISGIVKSTHGRSVNITRSLDRRGIYNVRMQISSNPESTRA
jgi:V4R domain-containing protein